MPLWQAKGVPPFLPYGLRNLQGPIRPLHAGGPAFPAACDVWFVDREDGGRRLTLSLRVIDGRPALVGLSVGPFAPTIVREWTARDIHELPTDTLVDDAAAYIAANVADQRYEGHGDPDAEGVAAVRVRRQRHPMTDDLLREVASVVTADRRGEPRRAVRNHFHTSERTASRWIALAKERGFMKEEG